MTTRNTMRVKQMLEYLSNLIVNYNYENAKQFHNIPLPNNYDSKYIWSHNDNGYTISHEYTSCYIDKSNGFVHKLSCLYSEDDFDKHKLLYRLTEKYDYRIEIPRHSEFVLINNIRYLYTVVERPNNQVGIDYHLDIVNDKVNNDYFIEFIDSSVPLLKALFEVDRVFKTGLPSVFILPTKRLRDDKGYFYFDFKKWHHPKNKYITDNTNNLLYQINYCNNNGIKLDTEYLKQYIENTWTIE